MPAYLVQLPSTAQFNLIGGADSLVVFAGTAAEAKDMAKAYYDGDGDAQWDAATATEIVAGSDWSDFELRVAILDAGTPFEIAAQPDGIAVTAAAIQAGGTGYSENDILTVSGGTSTRAATLRVTSVNTGVVDGIEVVDPGEYTVVPTDPVSVTGGDGNDDATFNLTSSANAFESMLANAVSLLNANAQVSGAAIDMGAGSAPLLTIAEGSGTDDLGDKAVEVEMLYVSGTNKTPIAGLVGTITDEGVSTDDLDVEFDPSPVVPNVVAALKA